MVKMGVEVDSKTLESAGWGIISRANKLRQNGREKHAVRLRTLGRQMVEEARADGEPDLDVDEELQDQFEDSILAIEAE